jgi:hypothetical protein
MPGCGEETRVRVSIGSLAVLGLEGLRLGWLTRCFVCAPPGVATIRKSAHAAMSLSASK